MNKRNMLLFVVVVIMSLLVCSSLVLAAPHSRFSSYSKMDGDHRFDNTSFNYFEINDSIIFKKAYYSVNGNNWRNITLRGTDYGASVDWLSGTAYYNAFHNLLAVSGEHYLIVYSCGRVTGSWDCHGTDANPNGFWQLYVINNSDGSAVGDGNGDIAVADGISSFTLDKTLRTSAGMYNENDTLVRTLWSNIELSAGTHNLTWDGLDDDGNVLVVDNNFSSYHAKIIAHNITPVWEGVIGNTQASQGVTNNPHRAFTWYRDMVFIQSGIYEGQGFIAPGYVESSPSLYQMNQEDALRQVSFGHRDTMAAFSGVAADNGSLYFINPGMGYNNVSNNSFIVKFNLTHIAAYAANVHTPEEWNGQRYGSGFTNGIDYGGIDIGMKDQTWNGIIYLGKLVPNGPYSIAVQQTGNLLFISYELDNVISIYNKITGDFINNFTAASPWKIEIDQDDNLWVASDTAIFKFTDFSPDAVPVLSLNDLSSPVDITTNYKGYMAVLDAGTSHQVKAFDLDGSLLWILGQSSSYDVDPNVENDKFYFLEKSFISISPDGRIWVADTGNDRWQIFNETTREYLDTLQWLVGNYHAAVDLTDPTRVFSEVKEFKVDYSKPLNESWTYVRNWGPSVSKTAPDGVTGFVQAITLTANGETKHYATYQYKTPFTGASGGRIINVHQILELTENGVRDTGVHLPSLNHDIYNYLYHPNSYFLGKDGNIIEYTKATPSSTYQAFYITNFTGFDGNGNPLFGPKYLYANVSILEKGPAFYGHGGGGYFGFVGDEGKIITLNGGVGSTSKYRLGGILPGQTTWNFKALPVGTWDWYYNGTQGRRVITGPFNSDDGGPVWDDPYGGSESSVNYAGNRVISLYKGDFVVAGYHGEGWRHQQANQWFMYHKSGLFVDQFGVTNAVGSFMYKADPGAAGNTFSSVMVTVNNELYVYHNDEQNWAGVHRWRFHGWDELEEFCVKLTNESVCP